MTRELRRLVLALGVASLPVLLDRNALLRVADMHALAESPWPWFIPAHAFLLYVWTPVVTLSGVLLCLSPGLVLALLLNLGRNVHRWLLWGLALDIPALSVMTALVQGLWGRPVRGTLFVAICLALTITGLLVLGLSQRYSQRRSWPWNAPQSGATLGLLTGVPFMILAALGPKIHWECFNGDGIHAFESARLLFFQTLPFWPSYLPDLAPFPDLTSTLFIFPTSWFLRVFGEIESAARIPWVLYIAALLGAVFALVESGQGNAMTILDKHLVALGLAPYVLAMGFSATYHPYAADIALPATQDTLLVVLCLGFFLALLEGRPRLAAGMLTLTILASPGGFLLVALCLVSAPVVVRPAPWRLAMKLGLFTAGVVLLLAAIPFFLDLLGLPSPGGEYARAGLLGRFRFIQFTEWRRIAFWILPGGILPALALFAWPRLDGAARALLVVSWTYASMFYVQAFISLHQFVPAMLLPVAAFWRLVPSLEPSRAKTLRLAYVASVLLATLVSMPASSRVYTASRHVGATVDDPSGDYEEMDFSAYQRSLLLLAVLPYDFDPSVPAESYGGNPHVWRYYAEHGVHAAVPSNYLLLSPGSPAPEGWRLKADDPAGRLFLRDEAVLESHRAIRPPTPAGAPVYHIPREILFRRPQDLATYRILDIKAILGLDQVRP